ncbi:GNAT family N-acetyltransferase [uncultured Phascolarctobacterium sp.]|uniref:GNAT family N-acetyltransferase n=1 Tax=uncultured Phascolarctobacterium sp. TaxID=512296 RepID=UPI0015AA821A|nr:GNAT family N-acetyltransferase [uncultured Phascolarctobacterium sp.]
MMLRLATMQDLQRVMAIVQATVEEMHAYGNYQWDDIYPTAQDFARDIEQGELFVADTDGLISGLICINQNEPAVYADADWSLKEPALVLHRMAVDTALRGRGTGSELLQQAEALARNQGLCYLKTDTYALNEKAQRLFLQQGYRFCGEIQFRQMEHQFYCYEKVL